MARRSRFQRRIPFRDSKPLVLIATEGRVTEPIYFAELKDRFREVVTVLVSPGKAGEMNPSRVLKRLKKEVKNWASWTKKDQAWLVVDTDEWSEEDKSKVAAEIAKDKSLHLASSNPCFEVWLLMHFRGTWEGISKEDLDKLLASKDCLGSYEKNKYDAAALMERIEDSLKRAKDTDSSTEDQWVGPGQTHVYQVVEKIITKP